MHLYNFRFEIIFKIISFRCDGGFYLCLSERNWGLKSFRIRSSTRVLVRFHPLRHKMIRWIYYPGKNIFLFYLKGVSTNFIYILRLQLKTLQYSSILYIIWFQIVNSYSILIMNVKMKIVNTVQYVIVLQLISLIYLVMPVLLEWV